MVLVRLEGEFSVCRLPDASLVDWNAPFLFFAQTDDEISLMCPSGAAPPNAAAVEAGWRGFKVAGVLDFGLLGVIAGIADILCAAGVSIFVQSTYNTDYVFVRASDFARAEDALASGGYLFV